MTPDALAELIADNAAETDEIADDVREAFGKRFFQLLHEPETRDPDMWEDAAEELGIDPEWLILSLADLNSTPIAERGFLWQFAHTAIVTVASEQAWAETGLRDIVEAAERHADAVDGAGASVARALAKTGVAKRTFDEAKDRRRAAKDAV